MTFEQIVGFALGINALITVGNAIYMMLSAPGGRALAEIKALSGKFDADADLRARHRTEAEARFQLVETRLTMVEKELAHLPTKESITDVKLEVTGLKGDLRVQGLAVQSATAALNRLEDGIYEASRRFSERQAGLTERENQLRLREAELSRRPQRGQS